MIINNSDFLQATYNIAKSVLSYPVPDTLQKRLNQGAFILMLSQSIISESDRLMEKAVEEYDKTNSPVPIEIDLEAEEVVELLMRRLNDLTKNDYNSIF